MMGVSCRGASRLPAALRCYVLPARSHTTFSTRGLFSQLPHSALRTTLRPLRLGQMLAPTHSVVGGIPALGRTMATKASQRNKSATAQPAGPQKSKKPFQSPILLYEYPAMKNTFRVLTGFVSVQAAATFFGYFIYESPASIAMDAESPYLGLGMAACTAMYILLVRGVASRTVGRIRQVGTYSLDISTHTMFGNLKTTNYPMAVLHVGSEQLRSDTVGTNYIFKVAGVKYYFILPKKGQFKRPGVLAEFGLKPFHLPEK